MSVNKTLNIQIPDKLYLALTKAAKQKGISLAGLVRMLSSDWVMGQDIGIKGVFTYPERLLEGMTEDARKKALDIVAYGGSNYNEYGEAVYDPDEDGEFDHLYDSMCNPDEIEANIRQMKERRNRT